MRVLVLGAGGYIGIELVNSLISGGHHVVALDRYFFGADLLESHIDNKDKLSIIYRDIRNLDLETFEDIDVVFDLAGLSNDPSCDLSPTLTEEINAFPVRVNGEKAKNAGVKRYIYFSSCSVYGAGGEDSVSEESPFAPVSNYAKAKIYAEEALLPMSSNDFAVTCMRNATVYGYAPRMRFDLVVNIMTKIALTEGRIVVLGGGKQWRPLVHVKDVVSAALNIMNAPLSTVQGHAFNVGCNEQNYTVMEIANKVATAIAKDVEIIIAPDDADKRSYRVNFDKIKNQLNWQPEHDIEETVSEISKLISSGKLDPDDPRWNTLKYYQFLMSNYELIKKIELDGRLL